MTEMSGWLRQSDGECLFPEQDETLAAGLYFENGEHSQVLLKNTSTGEVMDLPDDGMVFIVLDRTAAYDIRDALLNPNEYPETL